MSNQLTRLDQIGQFPLRQPLTEERIDGNPNPQTSPTALRNLGQNRPSDEFGPSQGVASMEQSSSIPPTNHRSARFATIYPPQTVRTTEDTPQTTYFPNFTHLNHNFNNPSAPKRKQLIRTHPPIYALHNDRIQDHLDLLATQTSNLVNQTASMPHSVSTTGTHNTAQGLIDVAQYPHQITQGSMRLSHMNNDLSTDRHSPFQSRDNSYSQYASSAYNIYPHKQASSQHIQFIKDQDQFNVPTLRNHNPSIHRQQNQHSSDNSNDMTYQSTHQYQYHNSGINQTPSRQNHPFPAQSSAHDSHLPNHRNSGHFTTAITATDPHFRFFHTASPHLPPTHLHHSSPHTNSTQLHNQGADLRNRSNSTSDTQQSHSSPISIQHTPVLFSGHHISPLHYTLHENQLEYSSSEQQFQHLQQPRFHQQPQHQDRHQQLQQHPQILEQGSDAFYPTINNKLNIHQTIANQNSFHQPDVVNPATIPISIQPHHSQQTRPQNHNQISKSYQIPLNPSDPVLNPSTATKNAPPNPQNLESQIHPAENQKSHSLNNSIINTSASANSPSPPTPIRLPEAPFFPQPHQPTQQPLQSQYTQIQSTRHPDVNTGNHRNGDMNHNVNNHQNDSLNHKAHNEISTQHQSSSFQLVPPTPAHSNTNASNFSDFITNRQLEDWPTPSNFSQGPNITNSLQFNSTLPLNESTMTTDMCNPFDHRSHTTTATFPHDDNLNNNCPNSMHLPSPPRVAAHTELLETLHAHRAIARHQHELNQLHRDPTSPKRRSLRPQSNNRLNRRRSSIGNANTSGNNKYSNATSSSDDFDHDDQGEYSIGLSSRTKRQCRDRFMFPTSANTATTRTLSNSTFSDIDTQTTMPGSIMHRDQIEQMGFTLKTQSDGSMMTIFASSSSNEENTANNAMNSRFETTPKQLRPLIRAIFDEEEEQEQLAALEKKAQAEAQSNNSTNTTPLNTPGDCDNDGKMDCGDVSTGVNTKTTLNQMNHHIANSNSNIASQTFKTSPTGTVRSLHSHSNGSWAESDLVMVPKELSTNPQRIKQISITNLLFSPLNMNQSSAASSIPKASKSAQFANTAQMFLNGKSPNSTSKSSFLPSLPPFTNPHGGPTAHIFRSQSPVPGWTGAGNRPRLDVVSDDDHDDYDDGFVIVESYSPLSSSNRCSFTHHNRSGSPQNLPNLRSSFTGISSQRRQDMHNNPNSSRNAVAQNTNANNDHHLTRDRFPVHSSTGCQGYYNNSPSINRVFSANNHCRATDDDDDDDNNNNFNFPTSSSLPRSPCSRNQKLRGNTVESPKHITKTLSIESVLQLPGAFARSPNQHRTGDLILEQESIDPSSPRYHERRNPALVVSSAEGNNMDDHISVESIQSAASAARASLSSKSICEMKFCKNGNHEHNYSGARNAGNGSNNPTNNFSNPRVNNSTMMTHHNGFPTMLPNHHNNHSQTGTRPLDNNKPANQTHFPSHTQASSRNPQSPRAHMQLSPVCSDDMSQGEDFARQCDCVFSTTDQSQSRSPLSMTNDLLSSYSHQGHSRTFKHNPREFGSNQFQHLVVQHQQSHQQLPHHTNHHQYQSKEAILEDASGHFAHSHSNSNDLSHPTDPTEFVQLDPIKPQILLTIPPSSTFLASTFFASNPFINSSAISNQGPPPPRCSAASITSSIRTRSTSSPDPHSPIKSNATLDTSNLTSSPTIKPYNVQTHHLPQPQSTPQKVLQPSTITHPTHITNQQLTLAVSRTLSHHNTGTSTPIVTINGTQSNLHMNSITIPNSTSTTGPTAVMDESEQKSEERERDALLSLIIKQKQQVQQKLARREEISMPRSLLGSISHITVQKAIQQHVASTPPFDSHHTWNPAPSTPIIVSHSDLATNHTDSHHQHLSLLSTNEHPFSLNRREEMINGDDFEVFGPKKRKPRSYDISGTVLEEDHVNLKNQADE